MKKIPRLIMNFKCSCGSKKCYREPGMESLGVYEGHYHCTECNKEYDYASDEIQLALQYDSVQLTLF